jgi:hypothetical protein
MSIGLREKNGAFVQFDALIPLELKGARWKKSLQCGSIRVASSDMDSHSDPPAIEDVRHRGCSLTLYFHCAPTSPNYMQTILEKISFRMNVLRKLKALGDLTRLG